MTDLGRTLQRPVRLVVVYTMLEIERKELRWPRNHRAQDILGRAKSFSDQENFNMERLEIDTGIYLLSLPTKLIHGHQF